MGKGKRGNTLERWEVAVVKAMLDRGGYNDQDILAYFTRPTRSVNHRLIGEIRTEKKHKALNPASADALDEFLATWPDHDAQTGLSLRGDELLLKAREAMIAAVQTFNGAGLNFRAELFIVTAIIAWTYLLHAWFRREGIDHRYKDKNGALMKTKQGGEKYWELSACLKHAKCPLEKGVLRNLEFLLELRHEIEHRSTTRIDDAVSAKLQACCINFSDAIRTLFGQQFGLERRLPIALQFVTFSPDQRAILKKASDLPANVQSMMDAFHNGLTEEEQADQRFAYRVAFVPKIGKRASASDLAVEFFKEDSEEAKAVEKVLLKEVDKKRYTPGDVVKIMKKEGYKKFDITRHTELWKSLDARDPAKGFGKKGMYKGTWEWFEPWVDRVRAHCQEHAARYQ
jgi:hypothetical protein